jgi:predicted methyltransferase
MSAAFLHTQPRSPTARATSGGERLALAELCSAIVDSRPEPNRELDQFLMSRLSLQQQCQVLIGRYAWSSSSMLMIGDDDHCSVALAAFTTTQIVVAEIDERIVGSLLAWKESLALHNLRVVSADIAELRRDLANGWGEFGGFYFNPPYDRRGRGAEICRWLRLAHAASCCGCTGTVVLPACGTDNAWIHDVWRSVFDTCRELELLVTEVGAERHVYEGTTDPLLQSANLHLRHVSLVAAPHRQASGRAEN